MHILESSKKKLNTLGSFLDPRPAIRSLRSSRTYSFDQQWILLFLGLLIFGLLVLRFHRPSVPTSVAIPSEEFAVEVSGEVDQPGIFLFPKPPTLREALAKAGGLEEASRAEDGFLSEPLRSGALLTVARTPDGNLQVHVGKMEAKKLLVFFIPLDLNRVTVEDLCLIPGVGESLAREIVAYREKRKGFRTLRELRQVTGIGETKSKALQAYLTVQ